MSREIKLDSEFYIGNITEISSTILDAIRSDIEIIVDLGAVERIDTAAIQLILAARKEAECLGATIRFFPSDTAKVFSASIGVAL